MLRYAARFHEKSQELFHKKIQKIKKNSKKNSKKIQKKNSKKNFEMFWKLQLPGSQKLFERKRRRKLLSDGAAASL
jgi:hypothetical protein